MMSLVLLPSHCSRPPIVVIAVLMLVLGLDGVVEAEDFTCKREGKQADSTYLEQGICLNSQDPKSVRSPECPNPCDNAQGCDLQTRTPTIVLNSKEPSARFDENGGVAIQFKVEGCIPDGKDSDKGTMGPLSEQQLKDQGYQLRFDDMQSGKPKPFGSATQGEGSSASKPLPGPDGKIYTVVTLDTSISIIDATAWGNLIDATKLFIGRVADPKLEERLKHNIMVLLVGQATGTMYVDFTNDHDKLYGALEKLRGLTT